MVLCASAASQMLWQQAETEALTTRLLSSPGCVDPDGGLTKTHDHNHNLPFTHVPELYCGPVLLDQTETSPLPHFENELNLNSK